MKIIRLLPSGTEVPCEEGQTVLSALEKAGFALPNNCRAGACGECKVKVCSGEIDQGFVLDMALPRAEREEGFGLMCMAKSMSEVLEIEYGTEDALPKLFPPREGMVYVVTEKSLVTSRIIRLRLRGLGDALRFWPGQYISLGDPRNGIAERNYSIANIPNQEGEILLYITRVKDGSTSSWLHDQVNEGETLKVNGPYGTFIGDPASPLPVLCLAAGSGLAPIESLATAAMLRGGFKRPATVLFSAQKQEDLFDIGHFRFLESKFHNFKFQTTLTRDENPSGHTGRITELLPSLYPDLSGHGLFIAGSPEFVEDCVSKAKSLGALEVNIHTEKFTAITE
jgi:CDP-4-dehydro-6-deoxyglucose reductase, E3